MRSKILTYLHSKKKGFTTIQDFYDESEKKWDVIRQCGEHIFNFQEILEIRIKKSLKEVQESLLNEQFEQIQSMVSKTVKSIEEITNNDQLKILKKNIIDNIEKCSATVRSEMKKKGEGIKGAKAEWINDLI